MHPPLRPTRGAEVAVSSHLHRQSPRTRGSRGREGPARDAVDEDKSPKASEGAGPAAKPNLG